MMNAAALNAPLTIPGKMSYRATFADGQVITRKSHREYNAAWKMVFKVWQPKDDPTPAALHTKTGFARTKELAERARVSEGPRGSWDPRRKCWMFEPERIVSFEVVETEYLG